MLEVWGFYGEYGIQSCDGFDEEHLTAGFYGCGRWSFSGTLDSFEDWTRQWFKDNPKKPNGEPICATTEEQYENFLKIMCENNLVIEMDFEDVEEKCKEARILLLCNPHNPVGRVWKKQELQKLLQLCEKYDITVISDDIHMDITYKEKGIPVLKLASDCRCFICSSPSKTFNIPSLQGSYVILSGISNL